MTEETYPGPTSEGLAKMGAGAQAEMPRYRSHKTVHALPIKMVEVVDGGALLFFDAPGFEPLPVTAAWYERHKDDLTTRAGYYVVYEDGYASWSPAEAFESGYTRLGG